MYAVEISASGVESIKSREIPTLRNVSQFDGYQIPYPEKFFDLAIVAHVLEHVEHERIFLREISRVCKFAYIEVPLEHGLFVTKSVKNGPKFGHINFYSIETFVDLLRSSGMSVEASSVESPSIDYERLLSGPTRGTIKKNTFRRAMLRLAPRLSPWAMQYNGYSLCRCD
jgi:hypothetical protein